MYKKEKEKTEKKKRNWVSFPSQGREFKWELNRKKKVYYASTPKKDRFLSKSGMITEKRNYSNELVGIYKQLQWFGFVDVVDETSWEKKGYFVHETKKLDAFEGDEVAFEVQSFRGREEATIKKVLKRSEHLIVGTLKMGKTFAFVIAKTSHIKSDIFIPGKFIGGFTDGARVAVQIIKWEGKNPEGRIIEALADLPEGREDIYEIAFEMGARRSFSEKIKAEIYHLPKKITPEILSSRKDMRNMLTYTIDGAESKDLDDAISILPLDKGEISEGQRGWKLFVHIADVSHFVREDGELDREARKRGTSIYLVDQVIPMLPAELSNGLCSLHPGEDKLTLTCEMEINMQWKVAHAQVYESVILSDYRLTYREIDEILQPISLIKGEDLGESWDNRLTLWDSLQFWGILTPELQKNIVLLKELTDILWKNTKARGALDFDFPETKIILDEAGKPIEYKKYERYDSYKIIEECMVLANESVAKLYAKYPFLYRIHEKPDNEDIEKFMKIIETVDSSLGNSQKSFQSLLETLKASPKLEPFQRLLLRSLAKARYSEKNMGHFGLALDFYSHFTSPIRRYPDLQIHRIMKEIITPPTASQLSPSTKGTNRASKVSLMEGDVTSVTEGVAIVIQKNTLTPDRKSHYQEILPKVARRSSETADRAEKMEYKVRDMLACKYMSNKIGEVFIGKISGMIEKGFFVELPNTIEGFIEFGFSGYSFSIENYTIIQQKTGATLQFGDEVSVKVLWVDNERYRVEFELV